MSPTIAGHLADLVLVLHVGIVLFVVLGLLLVVVGKAAHWGWVDGLAFRLTHLAAIAIVVAEAWLGLTCPLTSLEMSLRSVAGEGTYGGGFIEQWLGRLLYYDAPPWVFVSAYSAFGVLVAASWWYFPPRSKVERARRRSVGQLGEKDE